MYLNLDLLYVLDNYTFPLFYYKKDLESIAVYSPMALKSFFDAFLLEHIDHITSKSYNCLFKENALIKIYNFEYKVIVFNITEENYFRIGYCKMDKSEPFKLSKETKAFLKSNIRINKK